MESSDQETAHSDSSFIALGPRKVGIGPVGKSRRRLRDEKADQKLQSRSRELKNRRCHDRRAQAIGLGAMGLTVGWLAGWLAMSQPRELEIEIDAGVGAGAAENGGKENGVYEYDGDRGRRGLPMGIWSPFPCQQHHGRTVDADVECRISHRRLRDHECTHIQSNPFM